MPSKGDAKIELEEALRVLREDPYDRTAKELARMLGVSHPTAGKYLAALEEQGRVKCTRQIASGRLYDAVSE